MGSERANKLLLVVLERHELVMFLRLKNSSGKIQSNRLGSGATLGPTLDKGLTANREARRDETSLLQQFDINSKNSADIERYI